MNHDLPNKKLFTIGEISEILGVSIGTLRRWEKTGKIKSVKTTGGHRRYQLTEIERITNINHAKAVIETQAEKEVREEVAPQVVHTVSQTLPSLYQRLHIDQRRVVKVMFAGLILTFLVFGGQSIYRSEYIGKLLGRSNAGLAKNITDTNGSSKVLAAADSFKQVKFKVNVESIFGEQVTFLKNIIANAISATTINNSGAITTATLNVTGNTNLAQDVTIGGNIDSINGVDYQFPDTTATGYLKNDGNGDLTWAAITIPTALTDLTGVLPISQGGTNNSSSYSSGSIIFSDGSKLTQDNASLFWDDSNNFLGIGTNSPSATFSVGSSSEFRIDANGDLVRINDVPYSWPTANASTSNSLLVSDASGNLSWVTSSGAGLLTGSGTTNTITKWSSSTGLTDSSLTDDGTTIGFITGATSQNGFEITANSLTTGTAQQVTIKNNNTGAGDMVNGIKITASGSAPSSGTNTTNLIYLSASAMGNNTFNGIEFGSGLTNYINNSTWIVTSAGAETLGSSLTAVGVNAQGGLLQGTGGLTLTGTANINATGSSNTNLGTGSGNTVLGNSTGTVSITSNGGLNLSTTGDLTGVATLDTIATSATAITFAGAGTLDTTGTATLNLGTGTSGKTINIGTNNTNPDAINIASGLDTTTIGGTVVLTGLTTSTGSAVCLNGSNQLVTCTVGTGGVAGTGTSGRLTKFTGTSTVGDSLLSESGTTVDFNTTTAVNFGAATITFAGAGNITTTTTNALTLDTGTTGTVNIGTGASGKTINIGTNNTLADAINIGSALDTTTLTGTLKFVLGSDATGDVYYRDSSGNLTRLGIGSSGQTLTVSGGGLPTWGGGSGGTGDSGYWNRSGTTLTPSNAGDNIATTGAGTITAAGGLTLTTGALNLTGTSGAVSFTPSSSLTAFNVIGAGSASVFNIDSTNNRVGIGTTTPTGPLQVVAGDIGSGNYTAYIKNTDSSNSNRNGLLVETSGLTDRTYPLNVRNAGNTGSTLLVKGNSFVEINTPTLTGNYASLAVFSGNGSYPTFMARGSGTTTATNFQLQDSAGTANITALDNGNLGIGDSTPDAPLDIESTSTSISSLLVTNSSLATASSNLANFTFKNNNTSTGLSVNGVNITATGATPSGGTNTSNLLNLGATAAASNTFNGINFDSGLTNYVNSTNWIVTAAGAETLASSLTVDTDTLYVDASSNRVGIGDATPDAKLDIDSSSTSGADFLITNTGVGTSGTIAGITANSTTTGDILTLNATGLTTGSLFIGTGPSSTGVTDNFFSLTSDIGSAASLIYGAPDFSGSAVTGYGLNITATDATANANTDYAGYLSLALSGNAAKNGYGLYSTVTSSSTTADTTYGGYFNTSTTGAVASGTQNTYGVYSTPLTANLAGATSNVYGGYLKAGGTVSSGTINSYGLYVANGSMSTTGTSKNTGLYVETPSGADTNYGAIFAGGNVGIGETAPTSSLHVTSATTPTLTLHRSGAAGGTNAGILLFSGIDTNSNVESYAQILGRQNGATDGNETSQLWFYTRNSGGALTQNMTLSQTGVLGTASGIHIGNGTAPNPTGRLQIDQTDANNALAVYINTEESTATTSVFSLESDSTGNSQSADTTKAHFTADGSLFISLTGTQTGTAVCHATDGLANDDKLVDCTGTLSDYAERYPVENGIEYGEIVFAGDSTVVDKTGVTVPVMIRTNEAYQASVIGITSDNYSDFSSIGDNYDGSINVKPIALNGRVPVKVSQTSPAMKKGDFVTTSTDPGKAMKATQSGYVIGKALEDWAPGQETVMVFVNNTYYIADSAQNLASVPDPDTQDYSVLQTDLGSTKQQLEDLKTDFETYKAKVDSLTADQISGDSLSLKELIVLEQTTLSDTVINGKLNIGGLTIDNTTNSIDALGTLKLQSLALGNIEFQGGKALIDTNGEITVTKVNVSGASAGNDKIATGQTKITINTNLVTANSKIFVTAKSKTGNQTLYTENVVASQSFDVAIENSYTGDITFDWWIIN